MANTPPRTLAEALIDAEEENASLNGRLSAYRDSTARLRPDIAKAYDDLVERLDALDSGAVGPQLGDTMPEFMLPDANGELVSLASALRTGPVVVSINRGHWCPYCKLELRSLAAIHPQIAELGAHVISIMPDRAAFTGDYARQNKLPFSILSDVDLGYALSLGLIFWIGPEVQRLYAEVGVDLDRYHGDRSPFLPMASRFIVGQDGQIKARQVNLEFRARMEPEAVLAVLRDLRGLS